MPSLSESPAIGRFFKVMVPGFHTKLCLPPSFYVKLKGEIPKDAFLTSCKGTWRVEIGQYGDGRICFLEGWDNFVNKHDLKIGEFVVFEQTGRMHFDATIFDSTNCTKEFPVEIHEEEEESSGPNTDEHAVIAMRGRGRPQKRAAYVQQKVSAGEAKRGRGRPRKRLASPEQRESSVEILEEKPPLRRNIFGHTIEKSRRGRPRKRTVGTHSLQKETVQYNANHDLTFENEFHMKIKEEKEPYGKYVHERTIQMNAQTPNEGRLSNETAFHWKQNHVVQKIMGNNTIRRSPRLHTPPSV